MSSHLYDTIRRIHLEMVDHASKQWWVKASRNSLAGIFEPAYLYYRESGINAWGVLHWQFGSESPEDRTLMLADPEAYRPNLTAMQVSNRLAKVCSGLPLIPMRHEPKEPKNRSTTDA